MAQDYSESGRRQGTAQRRSSFLACRGLFPDNIKITESGESTEKEKEGRWTEIQKNDGHAGTPT
jgi:hypothetical protein